LTLWYDEKWVFVADPFAVVITRDLDEGGANEAMAEQVYEWKGLW